MARKFKNDSIEPLSAAIIVLSGANKRKASTSGGSVPDGCSLLTQREVGLEVSILRMVFYISYSPFKGYTTYMLTKHQDEIRGKSFAFVIIKRMLGEDEGDRAISHIKFTKDRKVGRFRHMHTCRIMLLM